ncbi:Cna B-type domain-containing protein, partial [Methanobrevibacter sp.]|uniref:Cna B-type domain-containing protein n=1 Tax=Methanobrevibacter sp. TaxID=66852 RepID=UPI0025DCE1D1
MLTLSGDVSTDELQANNDDEILTATDHDLSGSTLDDIQNYLTTGGVGEGDTIYLGTGTWTSTWDQWSSDVVNLNIANIIISGGTSSDPSGFATISSGSKIFSVSAPGVTIRNIRFTNTQGPALAVNIQSSDCTISNCVFDHCINQNGGAIYSSSAASNTKIENCIFTNNEAMYNSKGGAMYLEGSNTEITGCSFNGNSGDGAIYSTGSINVYGCNFTSHTNRAIYMVGSGSVVDNCIFINNALTGWNNGGAIFIANSSSNVKNSKFEGNKASAGGAIHVDTAAKNTRIEGCNFTENSALNQNGGAINSACEGLTVTDCIFDGNTVENSNGHGSDIYSSGANGQITDSAFKGTCAIDAVKANNELIVTLTGDFGDTIAGSASLSNLYYWNGKSKAPVVIISGTQFNVVNANVTVEVYDSATLMDNFSALTNADGQITYDYSSIPFGDYTYKAYYTDDASVMKEGYLYNIVAGDKFSDIESVISETPAGGTVYLRNVTYTNDIQRNIAVNKAITIIGKNGTVLDAQQYSRIFDIASGDVNIENITFINGKVSNMNGGAINIASNCNNVHITGSTFKNNAVTGYNDGGAINIYGNNAEIINCSFESNSASYGGAINVTGSNAKIEGCNFTANKATQNQYRSGGAISSSGAGLTVNECIFVENTASQSGDDIYSNGANGLIVNSSFSGTCDLSDVKDGVNLTLTLTADFGNAIAGNAQKINLSYWDGKTKTPVDISGGSKVKLINKNITLEIYDSNGQLLENVTNPTDENGQVIFDYSRYPLGDYTYKAYCSDDESIMKEGTLYNIVSGNTFQDIQNAVNAASPGEIIYLRNVTYTNANSNSILINKNVTIIGAGESVLDAQGKSGIIRIEGTPSVVLENIAFKNGNTNQGGAINAGGSTLSVNDCHFENNTANQGKAIYTWANNVKVSNSTFKQNNDLYVSGQASALKMSVASEYSNLILNNATKENLTYWDGSSYKSADEIPNWPTIDLVNQTITVEIYSGETLIDNVTGKTDSNGEMIYDYSDLDKTVSYTYKVYYYDGDNKLQKEGTLFSIVEGNKFSDIQNAINAASPGETIYLKGVTYTNDGVIMLNKSVSLVGVDGTVLDGEGKSRILTVTNGADHVALENIEFINGAQTDHGGAIYIDPSCNNGIIRNCSFSNNSATIGGGAIRNQGGWNWVISNTTFINNTVLTGDSNEINFGGGAIWSCNSVMDIHNSTFKENNATFGGALRGPFNIYDSVFDSNLARDGNGGAIDVATDAGLAYGLVLEFRNSNFTNNDAKGKRSDDRAQGGAIHIFEIQEVDMYNCICVNNTADRGGAVDYYKMNITYVENCTFVNNNASSEGAGLAIFCHDSTFKDSIISNNNAGTDGGAIWVIGNNAKFINVTSNNNTAARGGSSYIRGDDILVVNSTFNNNSAIYNGSEESGLGGALDVLGDNCRIINVTADYNNAYRGGAAFIRGDNTSVRDSKFDGNNATGRGGGLNIAGEGCTIINVDVSNNNAFDGNTENSGLGGGIYVVADGTIFINVTADNNTAKNGGGAYINGDNIYVENCTLNGNKAINNGTEDSGLGGGLDILGHGCQLINVTADENTAYRGGAAFIRGDNTSVKNSSFDGNNATVRGGGLNIAGDGCTFENIEVCNNNVLANSSDENEGLGGGIYLLSNGIVFRNITIDNNTAKNGGGAYIKGNNTVIDNCTLSNNIAYFNENDVNGSGLGGALDIVGNGCNMTNVTSLNNIAYRGGSTFVRGNNTIVEDCKLDGNNATLRGGGLNIAGENCTVTNVEVSNNNAGLMGGGIYVVSDGTVFTNITADNNTAERGGGAFINGTGIHVFNSEFNNNKAIYNESRANESGLGGGMDIAGNDCYINNTHSNNNTAYRGGSTFIRGNNTVIENCNLDGNNATLRGGGLNIAGDNCIATNISVSNNHAGTMGGGLYILSNGTVITNITANNNYAERGGSAFINGTNVKILNGQLNNNKAIYNESRANESGLGGGFDIAGDNILVDNVHSNNNTAHRGGSTFVRGSNVTISNCNLDNNSATLRGGALNIGGGDNCSVINVSLSNNRAGTDGGAVYVIGNNSFFDNVNSTNNTAQRGGSSFIGGNNVTVQNSNLNNNSASIRGGGLDVAGNDCKFINVTISDCKAGEDGGAVYVRGDDALFDNVTSINNTALQGGSSYIIGERATVQNSTFRENTAIKIEGDYETGNGGAINIQGDDSTFLNNDISFNHGNLGGGVFIYGGNTLFINNNFTFNNVTGFNSMGGAAAIEGDGANFTHNNFISNTADDNGGGVLIASADAYFDDIYAFNNTAENGGFAKILFGMDLIIKNSTFESNHATGNIGRDRGEGGAFHLDWAFGADIQGNFYNNTATNGSAIYVQWSSDVRVHDSRFFDNQAHTYCLPILPGNGTVFYTKDKKIITISHIGGDNIINAIHSRYDPDEEEYCEIVLNNVTYSFYNNENRTNKTTPTEDITPVIGYQNSDNGNKLYLDDLEDDQVIYYTVTKIGERALPINDNDRTDISGSIRLDLSDLGVGRYRVTAHYPETLYYTEIANETWFRVIDVRDINVTKVWDDNNNRSGLRPNNVTVELWDDNGVIETVTLSEDNNWNYTFENLPVLDDEGEVINYTVKELPVANYTTVITNITDYENYTYCNFTITNTYLMEYINLNVTKVWNDSDNQDGVRPVNVTVELWNGTAVVNTTVLSEANNWTHVFVDLPVYSAGSVINYTIREVDLHIDGYTTVVNNSTAYNWTVTNTYVPNVTSLNVTKVWNDSDNQDGVRPVNVTVE